MIGAGIFNGVDDGVSGFKHEMNRAQFAKVAALIYGLRVDADIKVSSFSDVKADDPSNGYAFPYIEAVKAAGITNEYGENIFNPAGKVTKEQLATFLIRGLGKESEAKLKAGSSDPTVSDWAGGYVALALEMKIINNEADGTFDGTSPATRELLVTSAYEAKEVYEETKPTLTATPISSPTATPSPAETAPPASTSGSTPSTDPTLQPSNSPTNSSTNSSPNSSTETTPNSIPANE